MIKIGFYLVFLAFLFFAINSLSGIVSGEFLDLMAVVVLILFIFLLVGIADKFIIRGGK